MAFKNCTDAYDHGYADIPRTDPSYASHLDRDNDYIACELKGAPQGFVARQAAPVKPKTLATTSAPKLVLQETLPVTGPSFIYGSFAIAFIAIGAICLIAVRKRSMR